MSTQLIEAASRMIEQWEQSSVHTNPETGRREICFKVNERPFVPYNAMIHFIEVLTFSEFDAIDGMLRKFLTEDWMALPPWARNMAFRLACLLEPENAEIRRMAANDLRSFGPDWDPEGDRLDREADEIERRVGGDKSK